MFEVPAEEELLLRELVCFLEYMTHSSDWERDPPCPECRRHRRQCETAATGKVSVLQSLYEC